MPINYKLYPPNWLSEIRPRILARAGNRCENCDVQNSLWGWRGRDGTFYEAQHVMDRLDKTGYDYFEHELSHLPPEQPCFRIIITVAHLDHDEANPNVTDDRLKALCQRCHLNHDRRDNWRRRYHRHQLQLPL